MTTIKVFDEIERTNDSQDVVREKMTADGYLEGIDYSFVDDCEHVIDDEVGYGLHCVKCDAYFKRAKIIYCKNPHPTMDKEFGSRYYEMHHGTENTIFIVAKEFFEKYWVDMDEEEYIESDADVKTELEKIFAKYNQYGSNPLSADNGGQDKVRSKGVHTSMSIGDMIEVDGQTYMVASTGFKKVKIW